MTIFSTALSCNRSVGSIVLSNVHAFRVKASQIHQHYHNMDILVSTLCDFAADYQGKLCIQGGFDSLVARQFPVVHPVCAVALRRQMILPVLNRRLMLLTIGEPLYPIERFVADITGIIHPSRKAGLKAKARMPCPQTRALQCRRYFTLQRPQTQQHVRQSHDGSSMLPRFAETIHRPKE